jgi:hypothetical protein
MDDKKPDKAGTVDYGDGKIEGAPPTKIEWLRVKLSNGNEVYVGRELNHPHGGVGFKHELYADQPEGHRTRLAFSLTAEACQALLALYAAHDVVKSQFTIEAGPGA